MKNHHFSKSGFRRNLTLSSFSKEKENVRLATDSRFYSIQSGVKRNQSIVAP